MGPLAPKLHEQMRLAPEDVETEQKILESLDYLRIQGILPPAVARKASNRVVERALERLQAEGLIEPAPLTQEETGKKKQEKREMHE